MLPCFTQLLSFCRLALWYLFVFQPLHRILIASQSLGHPSKGVELDDNERSSFFRERRARQHGFVHLFKYRIDDGLNRGDLLLRRQSLNDASYRLQYFALLCVGYSSQSRMKSPKGSNVRRKSRPISITQLLQSVRS